MSRINEMIKKLCPEGVAFLKLEECCTLEKGNTPIQKAIAGQYPLVVTATERKTANSYQFDEPTVCIPLVSSRGHGVASLNQLYYQEGKFALGNILCGVTPKDSSRLSARFLHYYLNHKKDILIVPLMKGGANVSLTVNSLRRVKVPVPPMEIQLEIVSILDKFEEHIKILEHELKARKVQFSYYLDKALENTNSDSVEQLRIEDCIYSLKTGLNPRQNFKLNIKGSVFPYITGKDVYNNTINVSDRTDRITLEALTLINKRAQLESNLLVFASTGTGTVGRMAVIEQYQNDWGISETLYVIKTNPKLITPKFLMYSLYSTAAKCQFVPKISKGSVPHLKVVDLLNVKIQVPSLDEQARIVANLDTIATLCNDDINGLPAEIRARRKQYEYYRNVLLAFKEV